MPAVHPDPSPSRDEVASPARITVSPRVKPLTIGINALFLRPGNVGGTEIYLGSLLEALQSIDSLNRYVVFLNRETSPAFVPRAANFETVIEPVSSMPTRIAWEQTGFSFSLNRYDLDVLLNPGYTAPIMSPCPTVTVFHDLQHRVHPEFFHRHHLLFWQFLLWTSARRSHFLVTPSDKSATDLVRFYDISPQKVRVIPNGVDSVFFDIGDKRKLRSPRKYFLAVSTLHPHKNFERLIRTFVRFRELNPEFSLVLVGLKGFATRQIAQLITDLNVVEAVKLTNWIPRTQVYEYFSGAFAFIHPSLFEGFGMSVVEALAAGVPVACSSVEPLRSITDNACLYFNPLDESEILFSMNRLAQDDHLRAELTSRGLVAARKYSWLAAARGYRDILTEAATCC